MWKYWNVRSSPVRTATASPEITVAVPETTGYTAVSPGAAMSMPLWNWKMPGPRRPSVSIVFQKRVRGSPK